MLARPFENSDRKNAMDIIKKFPTMYGVSIDQQKYIAGLNFYENSMCISIMDGDELFGIARQHYWYTLPVWTVGSMFFNDSTNSIRVLEAGKALFDFMTRRAEEDNRYDFYYIVRDNKSLRKNMSLQINTEFVDRYSLADVEVLLPYQISRYKVFSDMLAELSGKNTKTLVVRHGFLKPEFRENIWDKKS
jgi:hypothetical protein